MRLAAGTELGAGRYRLVEHLGSGGMASVWLATDERFGREVAIKVMADLLADDERWLARFRREARAAAALAHPHVVKVFDFGVEEHRPFLVMAHMPGGSLKERLAAAGDGGAAGLDAEAVARELLGALAHVHAAGIVHRDVKPGNVLLDQDGRTHLSDFGIARPQDATAMTQTGMVLGTMRYLAPEVAAGEPATAASDLYSAGCVVREAAGAAPDPRITGLVEALTQADPDRRPQSAEDALRALDGEPETATTTAVQRPRDGGRPANAAGAVQRPRDGGRPANAAGAAAGRSPAGAGHALGQLAVSTRRALGASAERAGRRCGRSARLPAGRGSHRGSRPRRRSPRSLSWRSWWCWPRRAAGANLDRATRRPSHRSRLRWRSSCAGSTGRSTARPVDDERPAAPEGGRPQRRASG